MTESLEAIRASAQDYLGRTDHRARRRALATQPVPWERARWHEIAEAGWLAVLVPEAQDGLGLGLAELAAIAQETGRALLPEPFVAAGVIPVVALLGCGEAASRLLPAVIQGEHVLALAWQEAPGQLSPGERKTQYRVTDSGLCLDGVKLTVHPGAGTDGWLVDADGPQGPVLAWVAADAHGASLQTSARLDGSLQGRLQLRQVEVASADVLAQGSQVDTIMARALDIGRLAQAAELVGVARQTLEITLDYMRTRVQFGKPIGSFQALQHRMVDAALQVELATASLGEALSSLDAGAGELASLSSRAKARAARAALDITRLSVQMHGAIGYTDECDVGLYLKSAMQVSAWLGNARAHQRRYAQAALAQRHPVETDQTSDWTTDAFPRDADWAAMPEAEFRGMLRAFFARHYPEPLRHPPARVHWAQIKDWYMTLSRQGWIAPAWPRRFGGMELPADKLIAYIEEQEHYGVARPPDQGLVMLGPILIRYGTPAQQEHYLPRILSGEDVWAQGYSEPNAGSDLASLRTHAQLEADTFIVNGQKTWATLAQDASHMFVLVRTDTTVKKQAGISFLLIDLASPGVTVRPIRTLGGDEEFAEVFFDNVSVPRENLVGELNGGWTIAKTLLGLERLFSGSPKHAASTLAQIDELAHTMGLFQDPSFQERHAEALLDVADLSAFYAHFAGIVKRGETLPPEVSMLKIWATETHERLGLLLVDMAAEEGAAPAHQAYEGTSAYVAAPLLNAMAAKIFSGSNEIQRNILAKAVLDLPS